MKQKFIKGVRSLSLCYSILDQNYKIKIVQTIRVVVVVVAAVKTNWS